MGAGPSEIPREVAEELFAMFLERYHLGEASPEDLYAQHPAHADLFQRWWRHLLLVGEVEERRPFSRRSAASELRLGRFKLLHEIGRGGQAVVYLAEDTRLHRHVAVKVLSIPHLSEAQRGLARFQREAEVAARLEHAAICGVYETGIEGRTVYIAMRYVEGESLAHKIERARERRGPAGLTTPFGVAWTNGDEDATVDEGREASRASRRRILRAVEFLERTARAVHVAHEAGIVHRDLKPGNIMVTPQGDPVVLDFGVAQDLDDEACLTATGEVLGTPAYMSPEQLMGRPVRLDRRTDVFSLGVTLYELVTLRRPFEAPTRQALFQAITSQNPSDPREFNPAVSRDLKVVLETALEKDPDRRFQTCEGFAEDLRRFRHREPILARPPDAFLRFRRWTQRHAALATMLAALLTLLAGGLVLTLFFLGESEAWGRRLAERNSDYRRLADLDRLGVCLTEMDALFPVEEAKIMDLESWLLRARDLASRLEIHRARLAVLSRGPAISPGHEGKPHWSVADFEERWEHDTLRRLVAGLEQFVDSDGGALSRVNAWLAFARTVRQQSLDNRRAEWASALVSIADARTCPQYRGLSITPQLGLVPIGRDPDSGLWEFGDLQTGELPLRDVSGRLRITEKTGLVWVLLPRGRFAMGAVRPKVTGGTGPNIDLHAHSLEGPVHAMALEPFLLSKFEMTQAQWARFVGSNPSAYSPTENPGDRSYSLQHPVENISWEDADRVVRQLGLVLPTEAQWEYGARGGASTIWWTGDDKSSLRDAENLADRSAAARYPGVFRVFERFDDGYVTHAPVGSFAPNGFGLHDVSGNVREWCRDTFASYTRPVSGEDAERERSDSLSRLALFGARVSRSLVRPGSRSPVLDPRSN